MGCHISPPEHTGDFVPVLAERRFSVLQVKRSRLLSQWLSECVGPLERNADIMNLITYCLITEYTLLPLLSAGTL